MKIVIHPAYQKDNEIQQFIEQMPANFKENGITLHDKRNVIKVFALPSAKRIVAKRFKQPNIFQKIVYSFFKLSKAASAFRNASVLKERGFETPHEIAYIEERRGILLTYCYYISEETERPPIREKLIMQESFDQIMADDFAAFVAELHKKSILLGDLNSTNVLYKKLANGRYAFSLIDINRMRVKPVNKHFSKRKCLNNLTRFSEQNEMFNLVLKRYIAYMGWNIDETFALGSKIKSRHDQNWERRKNFLKKLKL